MEEIKLTSIQLMMSSDELAYDLGKIKTPKELEQNKKISYMLIGGITALTIALISYNIYENYMKRKYKNIQ